MSSSTADVPPTVVHQDHAAASSVSIVFAEPEQGAPLARASSIILVSCSLSVEVRREDGMGRDGGGGQIGEANGMWPWGCRLLF